METETLNQQKKKDLKRSPFPKRRGKQHPAQNGSTHQQEQEPEAKSMLKIVSERFFEHKMAVVGLGIIIFFVLVALGADLISQVTGLSPYAQSILDRFGPLSSEHWLGTDEAGRDFFIRLVYGARVSLAVAFMSAAAGMIIGVTVGALAGYYGGWVDSVLMRVTDSILALPLIPIAIVLAAIDIHKVPGLSVLLSGDNSSIFKLVLIFILFSWMIQARLVRGAVLSVKEQEFVLAAKTFGMKDRWIIIREVLPNVLSPVIVAVTLQTGKAILFEAALSFLGLGVQPPTPTWGNMMNDGLEMIYAAPHLVIIPGFLIFLVVVSFNFLGDGLQDALDPKAIKR